MVAIVSTVAYLGLEARAVEVQVQLASGLPRFTIVGLPDNAVRESRERVRAAMASIGLALPPKVAEVAVGPSRTPLVAPVDASLVSSSHPPPSD